MTEKAHQTMDHSYANQYAQFLWIVLPQAEDLDLFSPVETIDAITQWENPVTPLDFNNLGVMALIEAEFAQTLAEREACVNQAVHYLKQSLLHPLGCMHYAILLTLLGEKNSALNQSIQLWFATLQPALGKGQVIPAGLVYLPPHLRSGIEKVLQEPNGFHQTHLMLGIVLPSMRLAFYVELRWLTLAQLLCPTFAPLLLKVGLSQLHHSQIEGFWHLHQAQREAPHYAAVVQSLYLAYLEQNRRDDALYWQELGKNFYLATQPDALDWQWAALPPGAPFTYVPFQTAMLLAVQPTLSSIVTIVVLCEGDWFEVEMEFWQDYLKPGMTVIDVGANVGVYTFSAAAQVGESGCVIALEPFPPCITCLEETKRINGFTQVRLVSGAASDQCGTVRLGTYANSEVNAIITSPEAGEPSLEVPSVTLDHLLGQEQINRVDVLKIDAEGHEMAVLKGAANLIAQYAPLIMYENICSQGANYPVAEYLQSLGYQLFRFQPFLERLVPVQQPQELDGMLNVIACKV